MYTYVLARVESSNLGVHSSQKKAMEHLDTCLVDRRQHGATVDWSRSWGWQYSGDSIWQAHVSWPDGRSETFMIQRWRLA